ncbi:uncharacterized protein LOC133311126 [Gastrolobium bilobum]|uniref:uncharacterized protein LOC133311126 n=1 Tax=Gastrolobium bilobum TaxID=150636 RepID=UPI002AAF75F9|nr:uncharacterized protein LOC133311126 [Gastrolobium bilobum]
MGQIASSLSNRPVGTLPSDTEAPRRDGKEFCKALYLRNGREVEQPEHVIRPSTLRKLAEKKCKADSISTKVPKTKPGAALQEVLRHPQATPDQHSICGGPSKHAKLHQIYEGILSSKRRIEEFETVALTKECSSILSSKVPPKLEDPGFVTIPCIIGDRNIGRALCDLGCSINLMHASIFKQLEIKSSPTTLTLQLADRSIVYPEGKVENILVKVEIFIFLADFIILDCEVDENIPIIVGRPFLAIGGAMIDVKKGELTIRANDDTMIFSVFKAMRFVDDEVDDCSAITIINHLVAAHVQENLEISESAIFEINENAASEHDQTCAFTSYPTKFFGDKHFESLGLHERITKPLKPSIVEPPGVELKQLPTHLKYAFLGRDNTLPIIVASALKSNEENQLLNVLKNHKRSIGWTMADIRGIN